MSQTMKGSSSGDEDSLEMEALRRKERLLALKRKIAGKSSADQEQEEEDETETETETAPAASRLKRPVFRSYQPSSEQLSATKLADTKPAAVETHIVEQLDAAKPPLPLDDDMIDWDLKRDVQKKLDKLDRRTQRAIAHLIRERLASGKQELLLSAINSSSVAAEQRHLSDDDDDD